MADYYPLLARALDALPDRTPALRKAVYDRARHALISQLRSLEPPLSEDDIDLERRALDAAIERLEIDHGGLPAPANDAASPPPARVTAPEPVRAPEPAPARVPERPDPLPRLPPEPPPEPPGPPALPPAPPPTFAAPAFAPPPEAPPPAPEVRDAGIVAPIPIAARRPRAAPAETAPAPLEEPPAEAPPPEPSAVPDPGGRQRPRIAVVPPRAGRSRILRNAVVGTVLAAVIALIAVAAFLLRDKPQTLPPAGQETAGTQPSEAADSKFGDRVSGDRAGGDAPRQESAGPRSDPSRAQGVSVAQRALLIEEAAGGESAPPVTTQGRATWRLDTVNGEQGQPLQSAVVGTVAFPDAGLTLVMTLQRNLDATLPASHTVSLAFSQTAPQGAARVVQDVGLLSAKDEEAGRGSPVSGLPVRVRENLFLIGLSSLRGDVERNTDLLLRRSWFDIAVRYATGKRAVLTFEKGAAGTQVMQSAFDAWQ
jgi:hypothetical protein